MGKGGIRHEVIVRANTPAPTLADQGSRECVIDLETMNAVGQAISPFIFWRNITYRNEYYSFGGLHKQERTFASGENVYMDAELRLSDIPEHFDKHTTPSPQPGRPSPHRPFIVDRHVSHIHWKVVEYA